MNRVMDHQRSKCPHKVLMGRACSSYSSIFDNRAAASLTDAYTPFPSSPQLQAIEHQIVLPLSNQAPSNLAIGLKRAGKVPLKKRVTNSRSKKSACKIAQLRAQVRLLQRELEVMREGLAQNIGISNHHPEATYLKPSVKKIFPATTCRARNAPKTNLYNAWEHKVVEPLAGVQNNPAVQFASHRSEGEGHDTTPSKRGRNTALKQRSLSSITSTVPKPITKNEAYNVRDSSFRTTENTGLPPEQSTADDKKCLNSFIKDSIKNLDFNRTRLPTSFDTPFIMNVAHLTPNQQPTPCRAVDSKTPGLSCADDSSFLPKRLAPNLAVLTLPGAERLSGMCALPSSKGGAHKAPPLRPLADSISLVSEDELTQKFKSSFASPVDTKSPAAFSYSITPSIIKGGTSATFSSFLPTEQSAFEYMIEKLSEYQQQIAELDRVRKEEHALHRKLEFRVNESENELNRLRLELRSASEKIQALEESLRCVGRIPGGADNVPFNNKAVAFSTVGSIQTRFFPDDSPNDLNTNETLDQPANISSSNVRLQTQDEVAGNKERINILSKKLEAWEFWYSKCYHKAKKLSLKTPNASTIVVRNET